MSAWRRSTAVRYLFATQQCHHRQDVCVLAKLSFSFQRLIKHAHLFPFFRLRFLCLVQDLKFSRTWRRFISRYWARGSRIFSCVSFVLFLRAANCPQLPTQGTLRPMWTDIKHQTDSETLTTNSPSYEPTRQPRMAWVTEPSRHRDKPTTRRRSPAGGAQSWPPAHTSPS